MHEPQKSVDVRRFRPGQPARHQEHVRALGKTCRRERKFAEPWLHYERLACAERAEGCCFFSGHANDRVDRTCHLGFDRAGFVSGTAQRLASSILAGELGLRLQTTMEQGLGVVAQVSLGLQLPHHRPIALEVVRARDDHHLVARRTPAKVLGERLGHDPDTQGSEHIGVVDDPDRRKD